MEVRTYRASTMHEALTLIQRELGPDAAVLHTREVKAGRLFGLLGGRREVEVTASCEVQVPSRLPASTARASAAPSTPQPSADTHHSSAAPYPHPNWQANIAHHQATAPQPQKHPSPCIGRQAEGYSPTDGEDPSARRLEGQLSDLQTMVRQLCVRSHATGRDELPDSLFRVFTDLIDADLNEDLVRELIERVRHDVSPAEMADPIMVKARIARMLETEIPVSGPIAVTPGKPRLVALVGPTGVGKTTTIAKLAANFRLRDKHKVGLITVDTYRIAAVDQLRTYADIISLPMQVVSSPSEMAGALRELEGLDLILMDTAGRSPRDEIKIQELKAFLQEAGADEVHLVLSSVAATKTLQETAHRFAAAGTTSLILTKLDEASGLGNLLPMVRSARLPLSYLTNGQNVPSDIETVDAGRFARLVLNLEPAHR